MEWADFLANEAATHIPRANGSFCRAFEDLSKRLLGDNHPDVANSLNNLALLYESTGRYSEAEPLYQQALAICEQTLGVGHPTTIMVWGNYARFLTEAYR